MGIFRKLLGPSRPTPDHQPGQPGQPDQHAVLLHLRCGDGPGERDEDHARFARLQERLNDAISQARAGELDGFGFDDRMFDIFTYGPDADKLWKAIAPVIEPEAFRQGSYAIRRYGGPETGREERINLHWEG